MEKFSHLNQSNSVYIESLYEQYQENPDSVEQAWKSFFEGMEFGEGKDTGAGGGLSEKDLKVYELVQEF